MKRVVITGMGVMSPIGNSLQEYEKNLFGGFASSARLSRLDVGYHTTKYGCEVKDMETHPRLDSKDRRRMDRFSCYAMAASREAFEVAELKEGVFDPERSGIILGVGIGGFETIENMYYTYIPTETKLQAENRKTPISLPPMSIPKLIINIGPANVALNLNLQGPCLSISTACASGNDAIGSAVNTIRQGQADIMISGGVEAPITHAGISGFNAIHALSTNFAEEPHRASRPFDKDRDGFVIGEGAGIIVLEELSHALARKAPILAEVIGYGISCDAYHQTAPHPEGRGARKAIQMALDSAQIAPEEIDYINAHGTSTIINDAVETKVIKEIFGNHAYKLKVSSTKSMMGHCVGAAGGLEAVASIFSITKQLYPPTINLDNPDEKCDLDYVAHTTQKAGSKPIKTVMSNNFGFGGHNGIIILREYS